MTPKVVKRQYTMIQGIACIATSTSIIFNSFVRYDIVFFMTKWASHYLIPRLVATISAIA